jgi:hypothetical protein
MSATRLLVACALLVMVVPPTPALSQQPEASPRVNVRNHGVSFDYASVSTPIAGVAAGQDVVFVGEPLNASVIVLSRLTGKQVGELPPPPIIMDSRSRSSCITSERIKLPFSMPAVFPSRVLSFRRAQPFTSTRIGPILDSTFLRSWSGL